MVFRGGIRAYWGAGTDMSGRRSGHVKATATGLEALRRSDHPQRHGHPVRRSRAAAVLDLGEGVAHPGLCDPAGMSPRTSIRATPS